VKYMLASEGTLHALATSAPSYNDKSPAYIFVLEASQLFFSIWLTKN